MKKPSLCPAGRWFTRVRCTRKPASTILFVAFLAAAPGARPQGDPFQAPDLPWDLQIVAPGVLTPGQQFTATASGLLNGDDLPDVVVLAGNQAFVAANPGTWTSASFLTGGVSDVAVMRRGGEKSDWILTVGSGGLVAWRWRETAGTGQFVPKLVNTDFTSPKRLDVQTFGDGSGDALAVVWDSDGNGGDELRLLFLDAGDLGENFPSATPLPPIALNEPPMDFAIVDHDRDGEPDVAVTDSGGLRVLTTLGDLVDNYAANLQSGLLRPFEQDGLTGLPTRLAWVRQSVSQGFQRLRVVDALGIEPAALLDEHPVRALGSGALRGTVGARGDHDLVLGIDEIGAAWILVNGCIVDPGGSATATFFTSWEECSFHLGSAVPAFWSLAQPVLADFDLDGYGDVLVFDDEQGTGCVMYRVPPEPPPSAILPVAIELLPSGPSSSSGPELTLTVDASVLDARSATHFEVIIWPWHVYEDFALDPGVVGYGFQPRDPVEPEITFTMEVDVDESNMPDLLAIEMRALQDVGGSFNTVDVATFVLTDDCDIFCELDANTGGGGIEAPDGCVCGVGQEPPVGINLGGLIEIPRLPPFAGGAVPIIPTGY